MGYQCEVECEDSCDVMESRLMWLTMAAHKQVLFDKIRERIEKEEGEKLDKIAELLVEASQNRFASELEAGKKREELRKKLRETYEE